MAALAIEEVKKYLRYDDSANDDALTIILDAGQRWIEQRTGYLFAQREVTEGLPKFPDAHIDLRYRPYVADSLQIGYLDGDLALVENWAGFTVRDVLGYSRVTANTAWPTTTKGITATYTAGFAGVDDIPENLVHALCVYAAMSDEDRASPDAAGWKALNAILELDESPVLA